MIGKTLSHYKILSKLGEGGMGAVYAAEDSTLGRKVALKLLPPDMAEDPERLRRFEREAKTVAALNHPNIVTIYSVEEADGARFLTMELVEGESLDQRIPRGGMPIDEFFRLAVPLADALSAAHLRGIVHRDLKPANVMVAEDGRVKILDFGLAKLTGIEGDEGATEIRTQSLTQEGTVLGTVPYMSPEQVQGRMTDHRTDIFSLGVILYEMATGRRPFQGDSQADLISSILRDTPRPVTEINFNLPNHLGRVVKRCLEKDPTRRYQTALDLRNELEELEQESGESQEEATPSVAVLPFADFSPEKDQDYFCQGIAEDIINLLVKIEGLRVASRTSAFQIKDSVTDVREIGEKLAVDTVLGGSVRKAGDRLRVTAQLTNVEDGYHLWSERYDRTLEDVFAIQDEIAESIVEALKIELTPEAKAGLQKKKVEVDVQAYDYYLRGRKAFWEWRQQGYDKARQMFARALVIDPTYVRAYAGVADCCSMLYMYHESTDENLREAEAASRRAIEIDPESAEAHVSRGLALTLSSRYDEAEDEFETALRLDPKLFDAYFFYARALFSAGKNELAAKYFAKAGELNAQDYQCHYFLAMVQSAQGEDEAAEASLREMLARTKKHLELHPNDHRAYDLGAAAYARLGDPDTARSWAGRAISLDPENPSVLYNVSCTYALVGDIDQAIDALESSIEIGSAHVDWIEKDPDLEPIRGHERYRELLESIKKK